MIDYHERTNQTPWSIKIKKRALNCLGHLLRLHETTPARRALAEGIKKIKRPQGRPTETWIKMIGNYLKGSILNINFKGLERFTKIAKEDFASFVKKYGLMCKNLVENQKQRIDYWERKGNKKIK